LGLHRRRDGHQQGKKEGPCSFHVWLIENW
jgi:hypothetical protein